MDIAARRALVGGLAFALGLWGWTLHTPPDGPAGWSDNVYRTLQLVTVQFPIAIGAPIPWQIHVARLLLPVLAAYAGLTLLAAAVRPLRRALPLGRDRIVVCGTERIGAAALARLPGLLHATAADLTPHTLGHARAVILAAADDLINVDRAMLALDAAQARPPGAKPLLLAVALDDEALAEALGAALDTAAGGQRARWRRISPDRDTLRAALRTAAPIFLKTAPALRTHILVAGLAGQWRQILGQLLVAAQDDPDRPPRLTLLLDPAETRAFATWSADRPDLPLVADLTVLPPHPATPPEGWTPPQLAVVLMPDAPGLAAALAFRRASPLGTRDARILLRQSREGRALDALGAIQVFGGVLRRDTLDALLDRDAESHAVALHARYLRDAPTLGGGSPAARAAWDALPETMREANRVSAAHAPILFAAAGYTPGARPDEATLDIMARIEHRRWMADRIERGWRHAPVRDDASRHHPSLIPYDALAPSEQAKDRAQVLTLIAAAAP